MNPYLKILRLNVGVLAAFAVLVGALVSGFFDYYFIGFACLVAFFFTIGGNVLNDYFDYEIDKINKPQRPIPSGKIKRKTALIYSVILFLIGIGFLYFLNIYMIIFALVNLLIIIVYDYKIKRMTVGHFIDAWLGGSPFLFGALLTMDINLIAMILFLMAYFANLSREITKGLEDVEGDKKIGAKTLAINIGEKARYVAAISALIAIAITPIPIFYGLLGLYYIPVVVLCDIAWIYSIIKIKNPAKSQKIMKIAMFLGIFAFLAGLI